MLVVTVKPIDHKLSEVKEKFSAEITKEAALKSLKLQDMPGNFSHKFSYSHDEETELNKRHFDYIRFGYVIGETKFFIDGKKSILYPSGFIGYVFYQGYQPSIIMPTQTVTYKGNWDFVSNAVKIRDVPDDFHSNNFPNPGKDVGAISLDASINRKYPEKPMGQVAMFDVNFGEKKLTGTLTSYGDIVSKDQEPVKKDRYTIEAKIHGNRFVGSATSTANGHTIFGKDAKNRLEGGFFGPKAEELAGKFLTDDNSLFVVFGAKRTETDDEKLGLETRFDAVKISTDNNKLEKETMDTFGNASYLVLDGRHFPLLPQNATGANNSSASNTDDFISTIDGNSLKTKNHENHKNYKVTVCCSNLDYVKFGSFAEHNNSSSGSAGALSSPTLKNGYLFLTGERTSLAEMEKQSGNAKYLGTWQANFLSKDNKAGSVDAGDPRNNNANSRAEFDFNFKEKTFSGSLTAKNGISPVFKIEDGNIEGNGFSGTAKTPDGGFSLDNKGEDGGTRVNIEAELKGAFYGPKAEEIGGTITSNGTGDKVGGVFGAKRQQESSAK